MFRLARGRAAGKTKIAEDVLDAEHEITHRAYQLRFVAVAILLAGMFCLRLPTSRSMGDPSAHRRPRDTEPWDSRICPSVRYRDSPGRLVPGCDPGR
jgi:hypothetical protein